jgi:NADPH:quinone reductase-like Zn-dependent oxidoreductase
LSIYQKVVIHSPGGYDRLKLESYKIQRPKDDEVQIKIHASGINYADICVRWGIYESAKEYVGWPITPGFEFSGEVIAIGKNVSKFNIGDSVFGVNFFDGYSGCLNVNEDYLFHKPKCLSFEQAAGVPAVGLTAYHALFQNVITRKGMKILVHSAAGGVGSLLVQLATIAEMDVVGVVGSEHKSDYVLSLGAKKVISKEKENWVSAAREFSPQGYDIILDANGFSTLKDSYELLAPMGKLISYGFHSMLPKKGGKINWIKLVINYLKTPRFSPVDMTNKNKSLVTFNLSFLFDKKDILHEGMNALIEHYKNGKLRPSTTQVFPIQDVAKAHATIESGQTMGKLVLTHDN